MIFFNKIRYKNFLSTGDAFTEIQFDKSESTLVVGENGAGKSTFLDALCFAIYGRPFRNVNKPQLINTLNGKGLLVELEFTIGRNNYMVRRGIKPNVFEVFTNGKKHDELADARGMQTWFETNIIKMDLKSFSQVVVLGSANYIPFMQLPSIQRRQVIEDLLGINIFSLMNTLLKDKINTNKEDISECDHSIDKVEIELNVMGDYKAKATEKRKKEIADLEERRSATQQTLLSVNSDISDLSKEVLVKQQ